MHRVSLRQFFSLLLLTAFSFAVFSQSGRKVQWPGSPAPAASPTPEAQPAPVVEASGENTIRVNTTLIPVPVSVTDRAGRFVPFLKPKDFVVYEDGVRQEIAHFSDDWTAFHIVLMLDTSDSQGEAKRAILQAATNFIENLRPQDQVQVTTFDGNNKTLCEFTNDRAALREAVQQAAKNRFLRLHTSLNTMLHKVITTNLAKIEGRKAVVLFTDGMDQESFSCVPSREEVMRNNTEFHLPQRTFNLVEENDVVIYPIIHNQDVPLQSDIRSWPRIPTTFPSASGIPNRSVWLGNASRNDLKKLADFSAGRYFNADTIREVATAFDRIAEDLGHQYTLGYYPNKSLSPGAFHHLRVKVQGEDVQVRARQSYRVPKKV